ncbi:YaiI/YqxD family protein [Endozoicomonas sp. G2_2]|uniref:YaiI/YqxD family protein n=1 Tax=Endozoicomonas sp. G2_2 TaxID=2821092 RepID=UPI001ADAEE46|nr:YaiI/YqxD family protein [Endozoicomonas sp. G2_2]MBO9469030.1 YaiI/YqxD family protein [Endozoicomonas sp. G2_2]
MNIWVDADACPGVIKDILFRAARRTGMTLTLVANQPIRVPRSPNIAAIQVAAGFDVADNEIVKRVAAGDLVITADIPLAAEAVERGALALSPRGELYTHDNVKARLNMRDFMDSLRGAGVDTGGPPPLHPNDRHAFAQKLDQLLAKRPTRH